MPRHDDASITDEVILIRAVRPDWVMRDGDGERIISGTFVDGSLEASCFIAQEVGGVEAFIQNILPGLSDELGMRFRIATLTVSAARAQGLWVYRKPEEYKDNPAHVVVCAADSMSKSQYKKSAGRLAGNATLLGETR
jgi:hypothetical protein